MIRTLYFFAMIAVPAVFGWWLFVPLALFLIYLAKLPYEIILAGAILDMIYYFGNGFAAKHALTLFSFALVILAFFLSGRIHWEKRI